jgi:hypothetical protein
MHLEMRLTNSQTRVVNLTRTQLMKSLRLGQWTTTLLFVGALSGLLTACGSAHIQGNRTAAGLAAPPVRSMMVAGVDNRPYVREPFENDVAGFLREHGVDGTASFHQISFEDLKGDKEQLRQKLQAAKAESILFVRVTDRSDFVQGAPTSLGSMDVGALAESRYDAFTAGGGDISTALRLGARLYRVSDGTLLWRGLLDTVKKEDTDSIVLLRTIAKNIVDRMARDKAFP